VNAFHENPPSGAKPVGYAWLMDRYGLILPRPWRLTAAAGGHRPRTSGQWLVLPERHVPSEPTLAAHLTVALKWEGIDLAVLDALFRATADADVAAAVRTATTGLYIRRVWFLHEWLTGRTLDVPDGAKVRAVPVVDPEQQVALEAGLVSSRHRVRDNLPGTRAFCPMVRRTPAIAAAQARELAARARETTGRVHPDLLSRAAAFLLMSDSRASYRIEGERPTADRTLRWARTIARAGDTTLSVDALERLQEEVIGDARFVALGLRTSGGFVGEHDRVTRAPIPEHISARWQDLESLISGMVSYDERAGHGAMDAVVAAAVIAFGFVYVHPFDDGNGRIHRWLIHHTLATGGFTPPGVVFPVSAVILRELPTYRRTLESYSRALLPCIDWRPTADGNVDVRNETASWYRFFDATEHAEFLYRCVETTVKHDLPQEMAWLEAYDRFADAATRLVDMPSRTIDLLHRFLRQNRGALSCRAREKEFAALTDDEVMHIEELFAETTGDLQHEPEVHEEERLRAPTRDERP